MLQVERILGFYEDLELDSTLADAIAEKPFNKRKTKTVVKKESDGDSAEPSAAAGDAKLKICEFSADNWEEATRQWTANIRDLSYDSPAKLKPIIEAAVALSQKQRSTGSSSNAATSARPVNYRRIVEDSDPDECEIILHLIEYLLTSKCRGLQSFALSATSPRRCLDVSLTSPHLIVVSSSRRRRLVISSSSSDHLVIALFVASYLICRFLLFFTASYLSPLPHLLFVILFLTSLLGSSWSLSLCCCFLFLYLLTFFISLL